MPAKEKMTIGVIANLIGDRNFIATPQLIINNLAVDSRLLVDAQNTLFFAIKARRDGHQYISQAYHLGVRCFVISEDIDQNKFPDSNWINVDNTLAALQKLAAYYRRIFDLPIIAITGSNGKTIVKEWLFQLLKDQFKIVRSPKSYNSQIGVPLSLWQINEGYNLGIFEAGISSTNEMQNLEEMISPQIGILTNIGQAHDKGFKDKTEKLLEKLKLFKNVNQFIYRYEDISNELELPGKHQFSWGFSDAADLYISKSIKLKESTILFAKYNNEQIELLVPFTDTASIENTITCWATLLAMGFNTEYFEKRISRLSKIEMRLQLISGIDNCSLIDDSYSADFSSLSIALDFLIQQNQHPKRTLILSDIQESGKPAKELYKEVAVLIKQKKINKLIGVGKDISKFQRLFDVESYFFNSTKSLISNIQNLNFHSESILIKGARKFEFEKIVKKLTQKTHDTVLEINLNAMISNLQFYQSKLNPKTKIMAMVKAFSYGSGSFEIANLLQFYKVDYLAVAYADEGIALKKAGISLPIMVMSPEPSALEVMLKYQLEPEVYGFEILKNLVSTIQPNEVCYIHLKIDTGMHRLGFEEKEIDQLLEILINHKNIRVKSIFTHLVASDDETHDDFTNTQITSFQKIYQLISSSIKYQPIKHILNTSGITRWSKYQFDMVRLGIGLYGFDSAIPSGEGLSTVAILKTTISQIKEVQADETIGYSRKGKLLKDGKIATVKIGYADGYNRAFGNGKGSMLVNGKLVKTVGAICMDMCMVDISHVKAEVGDEVIVFNNILSVQKLAKSIKTIPYEILTNVSQRVKRVYYFE